MKKKKITDKEQKVAAEILTQFLFCGNMEEVQNTWDYIYEQYELCDDPFTYTPCSTKDYYENRQEYARQTMMERYGHCDGL